MKTYSKDITVTFRKQKSRGIGDGAVHRAYSIRMDGYEGRYETHQQMMRAFMEALTPYMYGCWDEVQFKINCVENEGNKD